MAYFSVDIREKQPYIMVEVEYDGVIFPMETLDYEEAHDLALQLIRAADQLLSSSGDMAKMLIEK